MAAMTLHKDRQVVRASGTRFTTLCGRMNKQSRDGMNIADTDEQVTCKFCLRLMKQARSMTLSALSDAGRAFRAMRCLRSAALPPPAEPARAVSGLRPAAAIAGRAA